MVRGMVSGFTRGILLRYRLTKPSSSVVWPPTQEPVTMAVDSRKLRGPLDAGGGNGFARGNDAELGKAVEEPDLLFVEVAARVRSSRTSAPLGKRSSVRSTDLSGAMPERPAWSACQNSPMLWPSAEMTPMPVTATRRGMLGADRRLISLAAFEQLGDSVDHVAHRAQALRGVVGDIDVEFAFDGEKDIDPIQRVDAELLKGAVGGDLLLGKMLGRGNDAPDPRGQFFVGHRISVTFSK